MKDSVVPSVDPTYQGPMKRQQTWGGAIFIVAGTSDKQSAPGASVQSIADNSSILNLFNVRWNGNLCKSKFKISSAFSRDATLDTF